MVYLDVKKVYGPYLAKDNRLRVVLLFNDNHKQTISYPKYLIEKYFDRYLAKDEQVDHIDGNPLNNDISNLQILPFKEHQKLDALRNKDVTAKCKYCGKEFIIKGNSLRNRNRSDRHQSGYFCSKRCSGKYGSEIQNGLRQHIKEERIKPDIYKEKL